MTHLMYDVISDQPKFKKMITFLSELEKIHSKLVAQAKQNILQTFISLKKIYKNKQNFSRSQILKICWCQKVPN